MSNKVILKSKGKAILSFKLRDAPSRQKPFHGNLDLVVESHKSNRFSGFYSDEFGIKTFEKVKHFSWHGFYSFSNGMILKPVINIHEKGKIVTRCRYDGVLRNKDEYAYPICSLIINDRDNLKGISVDSFKSLDLNMDSSRVDIFVLSKGISFWEFIRKKVSCVPYLLFDAVYDKRYGFFITPIDPKRSFYDFCEVNGWTLLIREHRPAFYDVISSSFPSGINFISFNPQEYINSMFNRLMSSEEGQYENMYDMYKRDLGKRYRN